MKKKYSWIMLIIVFVLISAACQISAFAGNNIVDNYTPTPLIKVVVQTPTPMPPVQPIQISNGYSQMDQNLVAIYQNVNPGVVAIQTLADNGGGLGSGFVYDKSGHIITNFHVVEGATDLEVDFPSGYKVRGKVIATDLDSDIAVIKVDAPQEELYPLRLGDSDTLQVGQTIVAIGNPFGLSSTMTMGIVSAKGRTLDSIRQSSNGAFFTAGDLIQTDAAINPGNSGGPLLNLNGEVIGINRAIRTSGLTVDGEPANSGIGFAISVNIVKRVVPILIEKGVYDYPYLGISALPEISLIAQEKLGLKTSNGAYVTEVVSNGPAAKAGIIGATQATDLTGLQSGGDLIIAVDGQPIRVFGDLLSYLMTRKSPGDEIVLTVLRGDKQLEIPLLLGKRP